MGYLKFAGISAAALLAVGLAQQAPRLGADEFSYHLGDYRPEITFSATASLVQVEAVVRNGGHAPVDGLTAADFDLRDDGVPQRITAFEVNRVAPPVPGPPAIHAPGIATAGVSAPPVPPKPRYITIFFDDYNTDANGLGRIRQGVKSYIESGLNAGDWIGIVTTSGAVSVNFTQNRELLLAALNRIGPHPRGCNPFVTFDLYENIEHEKIEGFVAGRQGSGDGGGGASGGGGGAIGGKGGDGMFGCAPMPAFNFLNLQTGTMQGQLTFDSILQQIQYLGKTPGDHILLFASYGVFSAILGQESSRVIDAALRDHVTINTLDAKGVGNVPGLVPGLDALANLSEATGGRFFYGSNDLAAGIRELVRPPEVSYLLGFSPAPPQTDGALHRLSVRVLNRRGLDVDARSGYYAPEPEPPGLAALQKDIRGAVLAQDEPTSLLASIALTPRVAIPSGVDLAVQVNPASLPLVRSKGRWTDTVYITAVLFNERGAQVTGRQGRLDLQIQPASLAAFKKAKAGFTFSLPLDAPAGRYRLRAVVAEVQGGQLSSSSAPLVVPPPPIR